MLKKLLSAAGLLLVAVLPFSCAQNDPDAPEPGGYSTATQLTRTTAIPDVLPADGISEAALRLETFDRFGNPFPGRSVAFFITGSIADIPEIPNVTLQYCGSLSEIGGVTVSTDVTDANGVAWGAFRAGVGAVYGEDRDEAADPNLPPFDPCDCNDPQTRFYSPAVFYTVVLGKITDPRENEAERNIQDEVQIQMYGGSQFACGT
jgi:hypothetical protein